jgi:beta-lactamase superfamily II metal-dependent hydrolase
MLFDFGYAHGEVIWPSETSELASNPNNNSLVLRVESGAARFLLAGDIEQKAEKEIIADGDALSRGHSEGAASREQDFVYG